MLINNLCAAAASKHPQQGDSRSLPKAVQTRKFQFDISLFLRMELQRQHTNTPKSIGEQFSSENNGQLKYAEFFIRKKTRANIEGHGDFSSGIYPIDFI
jgi:hypothetical protein